MSESKIPLPGWEGDANPTLVAPLLQRFRPLLPTVTERNERLVQLLTQRGEGSNYGFVQQLGSLVVEQLDSNKPPSWHMPGPIPGKTSASVDAKKSKAKKGTEDDVAGKAACTLAGLSELVKSSAGMEGSDEDSKPLAHKAKAT